MHETLTGWGWDSFQQLMLRLQDEIETYFSNGSCYGYRLRLRPVFWQWMKRWQGEIETVFQQFMRQLITNSGWDWELFLGTPELTTEIFGSCWYWAMGKYQHHPITPKVKHQFVLNSFSFNTVVIVFPPVRTGFPSIPRFNGMAQWSVLIQSCSLESWPCTLHF